VTCRRPFSKEHRTPVLPEIPWRDVGIEVASRHGGTTCNPKQRCGNSLSLLWIACSENLERPFIVTTLARRPSGYHQAQSSSRLMQCGFSFEKMPAPLYASASTNSSKRRSSSGVQLLCRRAAPVIVLPNPVKVMAYCPRTIAQAFCRTGQFPIFATLKPGGAVPEGTVSRTNPARVSARCPSPGGSSLPQIHRSLS
jgi:hypothetical protein